MHSSNTSIRLHLLAESAASTIIKSIRHTAMVLGPRYYIEMMLTAISRHQLSSKVGHKESANSQTTNLPGVIAISKSGFQSNPGSLESDVESSTIVGSEGTTVRAAIRVEFHEHNMFQVYLLSAGMRSCCNTQSAGLCRNILPSWRLREEVGGSLITSMVYHRSVDVEQRNQRGMLPSRRLSPSHAGRWRGRLIHSNTATC